MDTTKLAQELETALAEVPVLDIHTHLVGGRLGARGLHDVLLYHMVISDLYAAGCPSGGAADAISGWPDEEESPRRIAEARAASDAHSEHQLVLGRAADSRGICTAGTSRSTADNWRRAGRHDPRTGRRPRVASRHSRSSSESAAPARKSPGAAAARMTTGCNTRWNGLFSRAANGANSTRPCYELERCWGRAPESPSPIGAGGRPPTDRARSARWPTFMRRWTITSTAFPTSKILSTATHFSTDIDYQLGQRRPRWKRRWPGASQAGPAERDIYASLHQRSVLDGAGKAAAADRVSIQLGAPSRLPYETGSRVSQRTIGQLGRDDRPASGLAVPMFSGQPARQPIALHAGPRAAQFQPGRLLVAQLFSRTRFAR